MSKDKTFKIEKEDFIEFLASSTPEEINEYIREKGKPCKLVDPMVYFKSKDDKATK